MAAPSSTANSGASSTTKERPALGAADEFREESDTFGPLKVPADRYWGAQTQRSLINFPIGQPRSRQPEALIRSMGVLKQACAKVNVKYTKKPEVSPVVSTHYRGAACFLRSFTC